MDNTKKEKKFIENKKYYDKHKDKVLAQKKTYYQLNRDTIKTRNLQRYYDKKLVNGDI